MYLWQQSTKKPICSVKVKVKFSRSLTLVHLKEYEVAISYGQKVIVKVKVDLQTDRIKKITNTPDHSIQGHKRYGSV